MTLTERPFSIAFILTPYPVPHVQNTSLLFSRSRGYTRVPFVELHVRKEGGNCHFVKRVGVDTLCHRGGEREGGDATPASLTIPDIQTGPQKIGESSKATTAAQSSRRVECSISGFTSLLLGQKCKGIETVKEVKPEGVDGMTKYKWFA